MRLRSAIVQVAVLLLICACGAGSGRQGTSVTVSGSGPTAPVAGGSNAVFVMTVTNNGPNDASNVKIVDNIGNHLKLVSITCTAAGGATCPATPTVEMTIPTLPNAGILSFTVTTQLDKGTTGTISNTMVASFPNNLASGGQSATATAQAFSTTTNILVSGTGPTGAVVAGSTATFVMTVTNNGPDDATSFNVFDNPGSGLTLTGITCVASGGATCPTVVTALTPIDVLPAGGVLKFTVTTTVGQGVNGTVSNELAVDVSTNPTPSANRFYATATVVSAVLSVGGTAPAGPLVGGSAAVFTMTVTNTGPAIAQNINISNVLSAGLTASAPITCAASGGAACPAQVGSSMTVASMPVNGVLTFTVPFTVNSGSNGQVSDTLTVSSTTDPRGDHSYTAVVGSGSSFLLVSETTPQPQINAGTDAVFNATVTNNGPSAADNVTITYALTGPAGTVATITCAATAGATCPATLGPSMSVATLLPGRSLSFTFTVPVPLSAAGQGAITNTVSVSAAGNANPTYQASASTIPVNSHNGTYQLFAADGNQYSMTVNFDAGTYTITDPSTNFTKQARFTADGDGVGFTVTGTRRLRIATNLIVGAEDFGSGVIPYVAGRVFGTTLQELTGLFGGLYNLVILKIPQGGPAVTFAATARVSGNVLAVCEAPNGVATPQNCSSLAQGTLTSYAMDVTGDLYTGKDTISGTALPFPFKLAILDATAVLLSATSVNGTEQFVIGLPDGSALAGGTTQGGSTTGDWVTMTLTQTSYAYTGQLGGSDSAALQAITKNAAPFAMLSGNLLSNNAAIYVMQSYPVSVEFGAHGGAASGTVQVTIP